MNKLSNTTLGMKFINREPYKMPDMIENNIRDKMIEERREALKDKNDKGVIISVCDYFEKNRTMGGEKLIKDLSQFIYKEFDNTSIDEAYTRAGADTTFREDIIDEYSQICIKQAKLSSYDLAGIQTENRLNTICDNTYELPVFIGKEGRLYADSNKRREVGCLEPNFIANHPNMDDFQASLVIVDHTNGKMLKQNCSLRMIVDLGQEPFDMKLEKTLDHSETQEDNKTDKDKAFEEIDEIKADEVKAFEKAVNSISIEIPKTKENKPVELGIGPGLQI